MRTTHRALAQKRQTNCPFGDTLREHITHQNKLTCSSYTNTQSTQRTPGFAGRGISPGCPQCCADVLLQSCGVLATVTH